LHFPLHPECETWDELIFGSPNMTCKENYNEGETTAPEPKPAGYTPTVFVTRSASGDGMASDQEPYDAMDFDLLMSAGVSARNLRGLTRRGLLFADALTVYGHAGTAVTTPVKSAAGGSVQPPTPPTAQKALPVKKEDGKSQMESLLRDMKIDIERVRNAAANKPESKGGLNMDAIEIIFERFGIEASGGRPGYNEKLSQLLTSLQL
jgi:hypothetical protein